jgi:hypothetical protein
MVPVGTILASQLRPLVVVWLLLTVPVVCHGETTVMVLGALTAGPGREHGTATVTGAHGAHAISSHSHDADAEPIAAAPGPDTPMWCAHNGSHGASALPTGQDGLVLLGLPGSTAAGEHRGKVPPSDLYPPDSLLSPPPAPPPRLLV